MTNYIFPKKIIDKSDTVKTAESLMQNRTLQIGFAESVAAVTEGNAYLILDFGKELSGGVRILTRDTIGNKKIRLRFGESVSECCADLGEDNATNDHALRDFYVELTDWSDMMFGNTGFRFVRIDTAPESVIRFQAIVAATNIDSREQIGRFECDDPLLNEIWDTAAYTLRLCIQNGYLWDGVKRDRLVWVGDLYPMIRAAYCLYGDLPEIRNSLSFAQQEGIPPKWMNNIPMYSFWWLINLAENCFHTGDKEFARDKLPFIRAILNETEKYVNENGETHFDFNFIDWVMHHQDGESVEKKQDELVGVNALLRIALTKTELLLKTLGEDFSLCEQILARLNRKALSVHSYKQAAALSVLSGAKSEGMRTVLKDGGAKGVSTFMSYPIFTALTAYAEYDFNLRNIKEYYGKMLELGATTFWEDFDIAAAENVYGIDKLPATQEKDFHRTFGKFCYKGFRHSLCHGWSSGVIPYLAEMVLGIKEIGNDGTVFAIDAHLSHLKHVKGAYPTTYGNIEAEYLLQENGEYKIIVNAPSGIKINGISVKK